MSLSESQAHFEGACAFEAQRMVSDNPYEANTREHVEWEVGWFEACQQWAAEGGASRE